MNNHKELIERLKIDAEWAEGQEWETPLCLWDDLMDAVSALAALTEENARLRAELEQVKRERDAAIEDLTSAHEITPEAEYAINKHADSLIERMDALLHADDSELEAYRALGSIDHLRELVQRDTAQMCKAQTIGHGIGVTGEYDIDYNLICPSCGAVVGDAEYNELNGPFCHECGQRLALPCEDAEAALEGAANNE